MPSDIQLSSAPFIERLNQAALQTAMDRLRVKPHLDFIDWAPLNIRNPDGTPFRFRPTQLQVAKDLFNPNLYSVTLKAYSGMGKTYLIGAAFAYAIEQLGLLVGAMMPNKVLVEDWINDELQKVFDATPVMASLGLSRDIRGQKLFTNGAELHGVGANSSGLIRRLQVDVMYSDEIDAIEQTATDEGDKLGQFEKRGRGRKTQHMWRTSYPSMKGASKIDAKYDETDRCAWFVVCPKCDHQYTLHTSQMIWTPGRPDTAHLICPSCGTKIDESQRLQMSGAGQYLTRKKEPLKPGGLHRGFHVGCLAHTGDHNNAYGEGFLHEVAAEREAADKAENPEKSKRVFVNTMDAESYAEDVESKPEADSLYDKREVWSEPDPFVELPPGVLMITMGVDVQKDRLEAMIVGWGANSESWLLSYRSLHGSPQSQKTWNQLDRLRLKKFKHPLTSQPMPIVCVFVDSGHWTTDIYQYTRPRLRQGVFACKGSRTLSCPLMSNKPTKQGRPPALLYEVGTHEAKDLIYQRLEFMPPAGKDFPMGYIHIPANEEFGETAGGEATGFFEMLLAEDSQMKRCTKTGEFVRFFDCPKGTRNEALDCFVYAMAAARKMNPNFERIAENLGK